MQAQETTRVRGQVFIWQKSTYVALPEEGFQWCHDLTHLIVG
jgi:hypothetical protein